MVEERIESAMACVFCGSVDQREFLVLYTGGHTGSGVHGQSQVMVYSHW